MRHTKTITIPATIKDVVDSVTCDLCGNKIEERGFDVSEVTIKYREGVSYPECGSGTITEFDLCGQCFETKLMPWLHAQGALPRQIEWDR